MFRKPLFRLEITPSQIMQRLNSAFLEQTTSPERMGAKRKIILSPKKQAPPLPVFPKPQSPTLGKAESLLSQRRVTLPSYSEKILPLSRQIATLSVFIQRYENLIKKTQDTMKTLLEDKHQPPAIREQTVKTVLSSIILLLKDKAEYLELETAINDTMENIYTQGTTTKEERASTYNYYMFLLGCKDVMASCKNDVEEIVLRYKRISEGNASTRSSASSRRSPISKTPPNLDFLSSVSDMEFEVNPDLVKKSMKLVKK